LCKPPGLEWGFGTIDWTLVQLSSEPHLQVARGPLTNMTLPDIETVSAAVHEAWMESKRAQGVSSRKSEDGEELMVPYAQLSEKAKELDRGTVRAVYSAIRRTAMSAA
jgi:hypothetical protein